MRIGETLKVKVGKHKSINYMVVSGTEHSLKLRSKTPSKSMEYIEITNLTTLFNGLENKKP